MKRYLLKISYDGTAYHGWQIQPNSITVQETIQNSLKTVLGKQTDVTGCSRTDTGVHAKEFYCHLDCDDNIPKSAFLRGLNSCLPNDIAVVDATEVQSDFHARYNAKGKNYIYNFYYGVTNPFYDRYALRLDNEINFNRVEKFCETIIGEHDFYGFSSSGRSVEDTVRTVSDCKIYKDDDFLRFDITANGFLYNMVRIIVGTMLDVSSGRLDTNIANEIFETKNRQLGGNTIAAKGLFLNKVFY
ncbi:MAG: tRNA pseudouridine(38-40) synthase TruA [Clostridia bacterium]|nr:tRNA pseudouridine(38-40) synthase TruA [Clostridia bacterium]